MWAHIVYDNTITPGTGPATLITFPKDTFYSIPFNRVAKSRNFGTNSYLQGIGTPVTYGNLLFTRPGVYAFSGTWTYGVTGWPDGIDTSSTSLMINDAVKVTQGGVGNSQRQPFNFIYLVTQEDMDAGHMGMAKIEICSRYERTPATLSMDSAFMTVCFLG